MQNEKFRTSQDHFNKQNTELIQELVNCALACEACASACLAENDVTMMTRCIELDRDCADTCFLVSRLLMRDSEVTDLFLQTCEEVCRMCAEECNKHEHEHCKICAEACERCAEACQSQQGNMEYK